MPVEQGRKMHERRGVMSKTEVMSWGYGSNPREEWFLAVDEPLTIDHQDVDVTRLDQKPGVFSVITEDEDGSLWADWRYDSFKMARLHAGLWERCGSLLAFDGEGVPTPVATDGQAAVAAWLRLGQGHPVARKAVAGMMDVTPQTVSNYCSRVRWSPGDG